MSFRLISLLIMSCVVACSSASSRPAPAPTVQTEAQIEAQIEARCTDKQLPVQLTLSEQGAENILCGPCRTGFDCHCGEEFCTKAGAPCP